MQVPGQSAERKACSASTCYSRKLIFAVLFVQLFLAKMSCTQEAVPVDAHPILSGQGRFVEPITSNTLVFSDINELKRLADAGNGTAQNNLAYRYIGEKGSHRTWRRQESSCSRQQPKGWHPPTITSGCFTSEGRGSPRITLQLPIMIGLLPRWDML